jgi:hypothetical protein
MRKERFFYLAAIFVLAAALGFGRSETWAQPAAEGWRVSAASVGNNHVAWFVNARGAAALCWTTLGTPPKLQCEKTRLP